MKAVITGSSGFVGRRLVKTLLERKIDVLCLLNGEIVPGKSLQDFFEKLQPDYIFHLASYGNQIEQPSIEEMIKANITKTYRLLDASKNVDYKAFINFSTSLAGMINKVPKRIIPYASSKLASELMSRAFAKEYSKPVVNIRPFNIYGEGDADTRFIPTIMRCMLRDETLTMVEGYHDWIYVQDLVDEVIRIAEKGRDITNEYLELGNGESISNDKIVRMISALTEKPIRIQYKYSPLDFIMPSDWHSKSPTSPTTGQPYPTTLVEGLKKTWNYFREEYI